MIKYLTPRSKEEIKQNIINSPCSSEKINKAKEYNIIIPKEEIKAYFKNAKDDKRLMQLVDRGKPIRNKTFRLKYPITIENKNDLIFERCAFYLYGNTEGGFITAVNCHNIKIFNCIFTGC